MPAPTKLRRGATLRLGAAVLLALAGCGPSARIDYAEVEGKVTLDGAPLSGVKVTFYPDSEGAEQLPYATGMTDATGAYALTAVTGRPGAMVGRNRAVVNWPPRERGDPDKPAPPPPGPPIPVLYTVAGQTPLVVEVKAGPPQTIDLPLRN
jgi:hypothetical protein